jgi:hypothetical protein
MLGFYSLTELGMQIQTHLMPPQAVLNQCHPMPPKVLPQVAGCTKLLGTGSPPLPPMCYYMFAGIQFTCGHTMPVQLEWLVNPCEDTGCQTSLNHLQLCDTCMDTYYTTFNVDSSHLLTCASCECNPCWIYQAQQEGCTPTHWTTC